MKAYSLLLGARNTPSGGDRFSPEEDALIRDITFRHFPAGFTILNANGGWFDPEQRQFLAEESRQILVCTRQPSDLRGWCNELGAALRQQELLVVEMGPARTWRATRRRQASGRRPAARSGTQPQDRRRGRG